MSPSGIETICVNAKAMRFAIMSPNHQVIKEQICEQLCTFSTADECFIMKVSESPVTAFPPSLRKLGGDSAMTLVIAAAAPPVGATYVLIDLASNGFMIISGTRSVHKRAENANAYQHSLTTGSLVKWHFQRSSTVVNGARASIQSNGPSGGSDNSSRHARSHRQASATEPSSMKSAIGPPEFRRIGTV